MFDQLFKFHKIRELGPQSRTSIYANLKRLASSSLKKRSIADEYDSIWFNKNIDNFAETVKDKRIILHKGIFYEAPLWFLNACYINYIKHELANKKPNLVYELGSGNGINIFALSLVFPDIEFVGLELTKQGVEQANIIKNNPNKFLDAFNFIYCSNQKNINSNFDNVSFHVKDVSTPNDLKRAEFLYSILAFEQMNNVFDNVVSQMPSYINGSVSLIEPFLDFNKRINENLFLKSKGYLHKSASKFNKLNPRNIKIIDEMPSKQKYSVGVVKFNI